MSRNVTMQQQKRQCTTSNPRTTLLGQHPMLSLFNRARKQDHQITDDTQASTLTVVPDSVQVEQIINTKPTDENELKKRIAAKLQNYRPIEREANFTGPGYHSDNS